MEEELRRLRAENRRLKRENEYLRHRAEQLGDRTAVHGEEEAVFRDAMQNLTISRSRSYFDYLLLSLKTSRPFRLFDKTTFAVRKFFFFSKLWRILTTVFAVVGISAQVILTVGVLAVLLPAAALFSAAAAFVGFFSHRRWNRAFGEILAGRKIYILFAPRRRSCAYFYEMAREYAEDGVVLIVSRSLFACGFSGARGLGGGRYRIHTSYYFSLAGRLDAVGAERIIKVG